MVTNDCLISAFSVGSAWCKCAFVVEGQLSQDMKLSTHSRPPEGKQCEQCLLGVHTAVAPLSSIPEAGGETGTWNYQHSVEITS